MPYLVVWPLLSSASRRSRAFAGISHGLVAIVVQWFEVILERIQFDFNSFVKEYQDLRTM